MKKSVSVRRGVAPWTVLMFLVAAPLTGQSLEGVGAVPTGLMLRQLDGVKRVLMIGAHPDDEDTALLTAMARTLGAETAYLSITRGDGGQNLIGPELWEGLGIIRTGELEAARRLDGGRQYFTRAFDFGYSKTAEESLTFWPHQEVLADVVWVIRSFRPHVVVAVWTGTPRDGHGQHTAAGILTREAFVAAGDPSRFPQQLTRGVEAWAPSKLYLSGRRRPADADVTFQVGDLDPLLGRSAFQLAMESRSQHRSQDMGAPRPPGPRLAGAILEESRVDAEAGRGLFAGIDTSLVGLASAAEASPAVAAHLEAYRSSLARAREAFGLELSGTAEALLEGLGHLRRARKAAGPGADRELRSVLEQRIAGVQAAITAADGIVVDVRAEDDLVVPGQAVRVTVQLWNGSGRTLRDAEAGLSLPEGWEARQRGVGDALLAPGALAEWSYEVRVPQDASVSRLYYLRKERDGDMYRWPDEPELWGLPRDPAPVRGTVGFAVGPEAAPVRLDRSLPWRYVGVDQARGEYAEPVLVTHAVSAQVIPSSLVWPSRRSEARSLTVALRNEAPEGRSGSVRLEAPAGWRVTPDAHAFSLEDEGAERAVAFRVDPPAQPSPGEQRFRAIVSTDQGGTYDESVSVVDYDHIERALLFGPAEARVTVVPARISEGLRVGYIMGTGDDGPEAIRQLGAQVTLLDEAAVRDGAFADFDVLVLGVRAYETREDVIAANAQILDFARAGGTVVVQYQQFQFSRGGYAPDELRIGRGRVSDQTAEIRVLEPEAPVFTTPNRITHEDFEGWVQERGLYFAEEWGGAYTPLIESNDPGEEPLRGALLVTPMGEGLYVYTGLSFFRQWSDAVPGAYRLFANLISLKAADWERFRAASGG